MRILLTNDDGIGAPGIQALATALVDAGHDLVVVAPARDMSGMSAALGELDLGQAVEVTKVTVAGVEGNAVAAPPALGVFAALQGAFGPLPDAVVSGVNAGLNTGSSVLHSGTVGAALTASTLGVPAMAVSVDVGDPWRFDTACAVALQGLEWLAGHALSGGVLNLNVPSVAEADLVGLRWAPLDRFGAVQTRARGPEDGLQFELHTGDPVPGSDTALVRTGWATATVLCPLGTLDPEHLPDLGPRPVVTHQVRAAPVAAPVDAVGTEWRLLAAGTGAGAAVEGEHPPG